MGGGASRTSTKSTNWSGYHKKRCKTIGCKKRVRHGEYCNKCIKENQNE